MALDMDAIKGRLNKLQNTKRKSDLFWKPTPGQTQVRIVPYKFNQDNPFIELFFHYNLNNKTYLSPISFERPDPIADFADKLKSMGDKEDWKAGKALEPKLRTFVPVVVRGKENEGVKYWGFGKTVYQDILGYIADPDYGDITDPVNGRDITIKYTSAADAGTSFPVTSIRMKPNATPLMQDTEVAVNLIKNQTKITDLWEELSYDELKAILNKHLNPEAEEVETPKSASEVLAEAKASTQKTPVVEATPEVVNDAPEPTKAVETTQKAPSNLADVESAFDDIFAKKS